MPRVRDIQTAPAPMSVTGVRSFLDIVTYCGWFMKNLSDLTTLLHDLTKTATLWEWTCEQERAFQVTKGALSDETNLVYFDPRKESELAVDASLSDLGAVLLQKQRYE